MRNAVPAHAEESAEGSNGGNTGRVALSAMVPVVILGLSVSLYLVWGALVSGKIAGCDSGEFWDCNHVMQSQWSLWFGIPVSIPGALMYLVILTCIAVLLVSRSPDKPRWARNGLVFGATAAMLTGVWFVGLQLFVIHKLCQWCLTIHSMSLLLFAIVCFSRQIPITAFLRLAGIAFVGVITLIAGQILGPAPKRYEVHRFDLGAAESNPGSVDVGALVSTAVDAVQLDAPSDPAWMDAPTLEPVVVPATPTETTEATRVVTGAASNAEHQETVPSLAIRAPLTVDDQVPFDAKEGFTTEPTQPVTAQEPVHSPAPQGVPALETSSSERRSGPHASRRKLRAIPVSTLTPLPDEPETQTEEGGVTKDEEKKEEPKPAPKPEGRYITFGGNTLNLRMNVLNRPILGSCDAPVVFIQLFDYTCPHCREMNRYVTGARQAHGGQLAVLILPVPLSHYCNPYADGTSAQHQDACELARLAIAVWKLNSEAFPEYHQWLSEPSQGRSASEARMKAEQLVGTEQLHQLLQSQYLSEFLRQHAEIYNMVGRGILPKLYSDKIGIIGKTSSVDDLLRQIAAGHDMASATAPPRR